MQWTRLSPLHPCRSSWTTNELSPAVMTSPSRSKVDSTRRPLTLVPLVLPKSSRLQWGALTSILKCSRERSRSSCIANRACDDRPTTHESRPPRKHSWPACGPAVTRRTTSIPVSAHPKPNQSPASYYIQLRMRRKPSGIPDQEEIGPQIEGGIEETIFSADDADGRRWKRDRR